MSEVSLAVVIEHEIRPEKRGDREARLVEEALRRRDAGDLRGFKSRTAELLLSVRPVIIRAVRRVLPRAGSLTEEDLEQVAYIEVIKTLEKFNPAKGQRFGQVVFFRVLRQCNEQIRLHGADVHRSDGAERGRTVRQAKGAVEESVQITSRDEKIAKGLTEKRAGGGRHPKSETMPHERTDETPESLLADEQMRAQLFEKVRLLPQQERELVSRHFGINRPAQSIRSIADEWGAPKSRLDRLLARTLEKLREMMDEEE